MLTIGVTLTNGSQHKVKYDQTKEDFLDLVKFNKDTFVKDANDYYILVSSISIFKFIEETIGGTNE
jgi:hypothetical protein